MSGGRTVTVLIRVGLKVFQIRNQMFFSFRMTELCNLCQCEFLLSSLMFQSKHRFTCFNKSVVDMLNINWAMITVVFVTSFFF